MSAELDEERLCIHVLDHADAFASELMLVEARVAGLFGLNLVADESEK